MISDFPAASIRVSNGSGLDRRKRDAVVFDRPKQQSSNEARALPTADSSR